MKQVYAATALIGLTAGAPCAAAGGADAMLNRAVDAVKRRHLLSAADLACSTIIYNGAGAPGIGNVTVAEKHGGRCKGDPGTAPARFHLEIDTRRNRIQWDNNDDREMRPIP